MPARSATVALGAAPLYLVDAPAGLAASALKCGPLSNCLIAPRIGQVCQLLPARVGWRQCPRSRDAAGAAAP